MKGKTLDNTNTKISTKFVIEYGLEFISAEGFLGLVETFLDLRPTFWSRRFYQISHLPKRLKFSVKALVQIESESYAFLRLF